MTARPLKVAIVAGEESGDLLAADLIRAIARATGRDIELVGVGGRHLEAEGLTSSFDARMIALVGLGAILADLPNLWRRIGRTARQIVDARPDCLITVDSPEFCLRVAKRVRAIDPRIPIIHYVCPSVWAWRPARAPAMKPFVDHVLCILPFEKAELARLGGPPGDYVGHRLTRDPGLAGVTARQAVPRDLSMARRKTLLILPGSRRSEVKALLPPFRETVELLRARGHELRLILPTVPHVGDVVSHLVSEWRDRPEIVTEPERKWEAFAKADAALIASGTVSLELALGGIPLVACYKLDPAARLLEPFVTIWSAILPNLIADKPVVPELYGRYVRPGLAARQLEALFGDTELRAWQRARFAEVRKQMATERASGDLAAEIVLRYIAAPKTAEPSAVGDGDEVAGGRAGI